MRHIRIRKRLPIDQVVLVGIIGVLSGLYIWQPSVKKYATEQGYIKETTEPKASQEDSTITNSKQPKVGLVLSVHFVTNQFVPYHFS